MNPQNLSTEVRPEEITDGFTTAGPNITSSGSETNAIAQKKDAERQSILEQVLTTDALARLGTIKVSYE